MSLRKRFSASEDQLIELSSDSARFKRFLDSWKLRGLCMTANPDALKKQLMSRGNNVSDVWHSLKDSLKKGELRFAPIEDESVSTELLDVLRFEDVFGEAKVKIYKPNIDESLLVDFVDDSSPAYGLAVIDRYFWSDPENTKDVREKYFVRLLGEICRHHDGRAPAWLQVVSGGNKGIVPALYAIEHIQSCYPDLFITAWHNSSPMENYGIHTRYYAYVPSSTRPNNGATGLCITLSDGVSAFCRNTGAVAFVDSGDFGDAWASALRGSLGDPIYDSQLWRKHGLRLSRAATSP